MKMDKDWSICKNTFILIKRAHSKRMLQADVLITFAPYFYFDILFLCSFVILRYLYFFYYFRTLWIVLILILYSTCYICNRDISNLGLLLAYFVVKSMYFTMHYDMFFFYLPPLRPTTRHLHPLAASNSHDFFGPPLFETLKVSKCLQNPNFF